MKEEGSDTKKIIIIPKEEAVFRMDGNGTWHNEHGKFEHKGIIRYFNLSIKKDENGYYVHQTTGECEEKVYFPYEDTALFVVDVKIMEGFVLILNTEEKTSLDAGTLVMESDHLYLLTHEDKIKFSSHALVRISRFIEEKESGMCIIVNEKVYPILSNGPQ